MKTVLVKVKLRPVDVEVLTAAAQNCNLTLRKYLEEIATCQAARLRPVSSSASSEEVQL